MATLPITLITTIFNPYGVDGGAETGVLEFDLLISEGHARTNTITDHPVENGSTITDHIKNELEQGTFTGMVSAYSLRFKTFDSFGELVENALDFIDAEQKAFDTLEAIWKARKPVTITTLMKVYRNVGITNIQTGRSAEDGRSITFNISFRQLNTVSLKRTTVQADIELANLDDDLSKQAAPQENAGRQ